jgi:hypothetical protein
MGKFLMVLILSLMLSSVASAQVSKDELAARKEAYWKTIDTKTPWGQWLSTVFKPYQDQVAEAVLALASAPTTGRTPEDVMNENRLRYAKCFEALQKITPPAELKKFHTQQLALYAFVSKNIPANAEEAVRQNLVIKKITGEFTQELARVFASHGVPQNVIDDFTKVQ